MALTSVCDCLSWANNERPAVLAELQERGIRMGLSENICSMFVQCQDTDWEVEASRGMMNVRITADECSSAVIVSSGSQLVVHGKSRSDNGHDRER